MKVSDFNQHLEAAPDHEMQFVLPDGDVIPLHAHITEIGRIDKNFIDCGGTTRSLAICSLQIWVAENDEDHRFAPGKLRQVMSMAKPILRGDDLEVEIEYEDCGGISQYPLLEASATHNVLTFQLGSKHTDCLAKEACGVTPNSQNGGGGCCGGNC